MNNAVRENDDWSSQSNSFCWRNISVWKKQKLDEGVWRKATYGSIQIVRKASGFVPQGTLLAVKGPSGCGKTTLLTAISQRLREGVQGDIFVNGRMINADQMLTLSGFVPQDDLTMQNLTVEQHFKFMAALKMDKKVSQSNCKETISRLMQMIGIGDLSKSYLRDLSGGEKRKLSIAVQLLTDPFLLFCDEPTTGLDSANAFMVVQMLKKITSEGKIIICSIHQPTAAIFELFDQVLLLARGGRTAYFGTVSQAAQYFEELGFVCPREYNIAEFLIQNVSRCDFHDDERINELCQHYSTSSKHQKYIINEISHYDTRNNLNSMDGILSKYALKKPSVVRQALILTQRSFANLTQSYVDVGMSIGFVVLITAIATSFFGEVTICSENSIQNIQGLVIHCAWSLYFVAIIYQFGELESEKYFVMRDIHEGLYSVEAHCLAKFLGKFVASVLGSTLFYLILLLVTSAFSHLSFWKLFLSCLSLGISSVALGCMMTSFFNDINSAVSVTTVFNIAAEMLSGLVSHKSLSFPMNYLRYFSLMYYFVEHTLVLEWEEALHHPHIRCTSKVLNNETSTNVPMQAMHQLASMGYDLKYHQKDVCLLLLYATFFYFLSYRFLYKKSKKAVVAY